jgi:hypothetical protein
VLAHRLLRRAECVARKVVAKNGGPLALPLGCFGLNKEPASRRHNTKHSKVVIGDHFARGLLLHAIGELKILPY